MLDVTAIVLSLLFLIDQFVQTLVVVDLVVERAMETISLQLSYETVLEA